ncbi:MAG: LysR family transcriptional regulator [Clostridia bacterium]|nr:LysR family transcriptional regulator [Clostridia bacterium]
MNIEYCRLFLKTVKLGSLTAAAEQSGYTQSALSHIISGMEKEFGFALFTRSKAGVALTQDGERMLPFIRDAVARADIALQTAAEIKGLKSGRVRIGAFSSIAICRLPAIIRRFNTVYPDIELDVRVDTYRTIEEWLLNDDIDCGFISNASGRETDFTPLMEDRLLALLPNSHPLSGSDKLTAQDIEGMDFIVPGEGSNYDIGRYFKSVGIKPKVRFAVSDDYAAAAMVKQGLGMTIMPELILEGIGGSFNTLPLEKECIRTIGIATRKNAPVSPACKAFIEFVRASFPGKNSESSRSTSKN